MEPLTTEQQNPGIHQIHPTQNSMMAQLSFSELLGQPNTNFDFVQNTVSFFLEIFFKEINGKVNFLKISGKSFQLK